MDSFHPYTSCHKKADPWNNPYTPSNSRDWILHSENSIRTTASPDLYFAATFERMERCFLTFHMAKVCVDAICSKTFDATKELIQISCFILWTSYVILICFRYCRKWLNFGWKINFLFNTIQLFPSIFYSQYDRGPNLSKIWRFAVGFLSEWLSSFVE